MVARGSAQRTLFCGSGAALRRLLGCLRAWALCRSARDLLQIMGTCGRIYTAFLFLNRTFPVLAALSISLSLSCCLSALFSLSQTSAAARWRLIPALRLAPVPCIRRCRVRGLPPAAAVRCVSMTAIALRLLWSRGLVLNAYLLEVLGAALRQVAWVLGCLGAVSLGVGSFPNHGNALMHCNSIPLNETFPVLAALSFSRSLPLSLSLSLSLCISLSLSVSPSLCLFVSPLPSHRLPLVGACSRRCGSRRLTSSAVVVFAVSLLLPLFAACP